MQGSARKSAGGEGWASRLLSLFRRKPPKYKLPTFRIIEVPASEHEQLPPWAPYRHVDEVLPAKFGSASKLFHCHIAGVTFPNETGGSRLDVIRRCKPGDLLQLVTGTLPEFPESVAVMHEDGSELGFLPKRIAYEMRGEVDRWRCCFQYGTHAEDSEQIAGASVCLMRLVDPPRVVPAWEVEAIERGSAAFCRAIEEVRAIRLAGVTGSQERIEGIARCMSGDVLNISSDRAGTVTTQSGAALGNLKADLAAYLDCELTAGKAEWKALFVRPTHVGTSSKKICGAEIWLYRFPLK